VGLAKVCRRAYIPVPERGYWAKLSALQPMQWQPLPPQPADGMDVVNFKARNAV
jgi:hypothetical protein